MGLTFFLLVVLFLVAAAPFIGLLYTLLGFLSRKLFLVLEAKR